MEEQISEIFDCEISYSNKIIASLKMNLPIQGATPKQMYEGYSVIHSVEKSDRLYEFVYCGMTEESSYATISLHRTREGAEKAMNEHKEKARQEWKKKYPIGSYEPFPFGRFEDWGINEIEVQD